MDLTSSNPSTFTGNYEQSPRGKLNQRAAPGGIKKTTINSRAIGRQVTELPDIKKNLSEFHVSPKPSPRKQARFSDVVDSAKKGSLESPFGGGLKGPSPKRAKKGNLS